MHCLVKIPVKISSRHHWFCTAAVFRFFPSFNLYHFSIAKMKSEYSPSGFVYCKSSLQCEVIVDPARTDSKSFSAIRAEYI